MRIFETGAIRDDDKEKIDPEGFLSPLVIATYCQYLHKHRVLTDGSLRDSDNWQKGIDRSVYMKSMWRHFLAVWTKHRHGGDPTEDLCALMFNVMGYLFETVKKPS